MESNIINLTEDCKLIYGGDYIAHKGFSYSDMNQLIFNLKKKVDKKGQPEYIYKEKAIVECASWIASLPLKNITLIPIPPSKVKEHPEYDNRMEQVATLACKRNSYLNYSNALSLNSSYPAYHENFGIRDPDFLKQLICVDVDELGALNNPIALVDDVVTTGSHINAARSVILSIRNDLPIFAIAIAKTSYDQTFNIDT